MINNWRATVVMLAIGAGACDGGDPTRGRYQGMIELEQVELAFEVSGTLARRAVEPGQVLRGGEVVATQDDAIDRSQRAIRSQELEVARAELALIEAGTRREEVRSAQAQLGAARASEAALAKEQARQTRLVERGVSTAATQDDIDAQLARARGERASLEARVQQLKHGARAEELARARARVALAEATLALDDVRLRKRVLTSPLAGVVREVYPQVGEVVAAGAPIASVVDRSRPYADVFVPMAVASRLRVGAPMRVFVEGDPRPAAGQIEWIAPHAEFTPRFIYSPRERPNLTVRARVRLHDPDGRLHAGLPAYAEPAVGP